MCQARASKGERITKKITAIATKTPENAVAIEAKRRLNPAATEFVSSRSESEVSSISDEAEIEQPDCEEVSLDKSKHRARKGQEMDHYPEDNEEQERFHSYQNYGWESPQGVLPPSGAPVYPHGHYTAPLGTSESDHDHDYHGYNHGYSQHHPGAAASSAARRARSDGAASPPPGPAVGYTAHPASGGMMPPPSHFLGSSPPHSHQYGPPSYPVYHVYPHHHHHSDAASAAMNRSASPPAIYPAGGSPPLAPGFISVPLQRHHSGHMRGSSPPPGGASPPGMHHPSPMAAHPSMGSSPPNNGGNNNGAAGHHYHMYAAHHPYAHHMNEDYSHPHHLPAVHHGNYHHPQYDNGMMAELQPRMSSMSLGSPAEGTSPTSSTLGIRNNTRASARIARSHRAGGAYNPSDFEFKIDPTPATSGDADSTNTDVVIDVKTTVMIRNIPNKYTQEIMLTLLEEAGLNGSFDFFYLPIDFRNRCGLGYAFLNFLSHADAVKAYTHFHQRRWDEFNSKKVCEVTYARVQGRDNLVQHFKNAKFPSTDVEYCPLVYRHVEKSEEEEDGVVSRVRATNPLPIHDYLASVEVRQEENGNEEEE